MAISHPSNLVISVNAALQIDTGNGRVNTTQLLNDTSTINFTAYSQGSIDITSSSGNISLGKYSIAFISSASPITINVIDGVNNSTLETKLFALNGPTSEFEIATSSILPVTVQFILGNSSPI